MANSSDSGLLAPDTSIVLLGILLVPAVRDASTELDEGRKSVFGRLMEMLVSALLESRRDVNIFRERVQDEYSDLIKSVGDEELGQLQRRMNASLQQYVPDASLELDWEPATVSMPSPYAAVHLVEDEFSSTVDRAGHGVQRTLIISMLQELVRAQLSGGAGADELIEDEEEDGGSTRSSLPSLVLAIEEPELYQHPSRQRHLAKVFLELATGAIPGVAGNTQIIYSTHSPLLVGVDRFNEIRLLRKMKVSAGSPKSVRVQRTSLNEVAEVLWKAAGEPTPRYTGETLVPRLRALMTPGMNEGFFADVVVLVEGPSDRAAILGTAQALDYDFDSHGIVVVQCGGKASLDRPFVIFDQLGIPTYVIWDSDRGKGSARDRRRNIRDNRRYLRLLDVAEQDWPDMVEERFSCFEVDLETTLKREIGEGIFDGHLQDCKTEYVLTDRDDAIKNPAVMADVVERARAEGRPTQTLEKIVEYIVALR